LSSNPRTTKKKRKYFVYKLAKVRPRKVKLKQANNYGMSFKAVFRYSSV
jgi:hypothetical protein